MAEELKPTKSVSSGAPMAAKMLATDSSEKSAAPKGASMGAGKPRAAKAGAAPVKKRHKHTHIEHHYDDQGKETGHTVRHSGDASGETSYSAQDMDGVHDGLEQHVGEPNADEGQPQMAGGAQDAGASAEPQSAAPQPVAQPQAV